MCDLYKTLPCKHCGIPVKIEAHAKWASCKSCRRQLIRDRKREEYARKKSGVDKELPVVVIHDPAGLDGGGFPKNAQFTKQDYKLMLSLQQWTPGTILKVNNKMLCIDKFGARAVPIGGL